MAFNENTRVKIPAILHLCRLGYDYLSLSKAKCDESTNIFTDLFSESIKRINKDLDLEDSDIKRLLEDISLALDNEDLGEAFYNMLTASSGIKLIDFEDFNNNSFNVVTELTYKNGDDEFRPDITLLINGMPLAFIEVKKPNNPEGILAERDRINTRFKNKKFRKFINITQLLVFSNNMEYDQESIEPIQGAFYSSASYYEANFNYFREEEKLCLFRWDEIPGKDIERLIDFLKLKLNIDWVKKAKIEKIDNCKTIRISTEKNFLLLKLNNETTKLNLEIDDGRTDEFITKKENDTVKIYKEVLKAEDDALENFVLKDNNLPAIKHSPEFFTNKEPNTPTNRILTSLFYKERLKMI